MTKNTYIARDGSHWSIRQNNLTQWTALRIKYTGSEDNRWVHCTTRKDLIEAIDETVEEMA